MTARHMNLLAALGLLLALVLFPLSEQTFYVELVAKTLVLAIFAMSLNLLVGFTGLVSFGHAAYFGIGAYTVAMLTPKLAAFSLWLTLPAALVTAALAACLIGLLVLRTRGIYFIMVTLAFAQMVFYLFHDAGIGGGSDGVYLNSKPALEWAEKALFTLEKPEHAYFFILAAALATYLFLGRLRDSSFGHVLQGIRSNENRMLAMGYDTFRYKLAAFTLAGALAGLAGFLQAVLFGFVTPEMFAWHQSGNVLLVVILGGIGSLAGSILGAFAFVGIQEFFQTVSSHWQLLMGAFVILLVFFLPGGLAAIPARLRRALVKGGDSD
ncbi:MAG: branched-chain amino acid ABC transporter permease [Rhodocyclaceae bacterium]